MKDTYEQDEARRLRVLYNQLLSYKYDFIEKVKTEKLSHEQRLEARIEIMKLTGEIKRLDWLIGHLLFGWEKTDETRFTTIEEFVSDSYRQRILTLELKIDHLTDAVRRLYRKKTKTEEEHDEGKYGLTPAQIIKGLNIF